MTSNTAVFWRRAVYPNRKIRPKATYGIDFDLTSALGPGVMILSHNGHVVYVAVAKCLISAIHTQRTIANSTKLPSWVPVKRIVFDSVQVIPCDTTRASDITKALIELHNPIHNRARPTPRERSEFVNTPEFVPTQNPNHIRRI